jgi:hypothetical protein
VGGLLVKPRINGLPIPSKLDSNLSALYTKIFILITLTRTIAIVIFPLMTRQVGFEISSKILLPSVLAVGMRKMLHRSRVCAIVMSPTVYNLNNGDPPILPSLEFPVKKPYHFTLATKARLPAHAKLE